MKHLFKFESFYGGGIFDDQMEEVTDAEYTNDKQYKYKSFTEKELQRLTDFCDGNGFDYDHFFYQILADEEFCFKIPREKFKTENISRFLSDINKNDTFECIKIHLFKTNENVFYMKFLISSTISSASLISQFGVLRIRKYYEFEEIKTLFKFVEDLIK
jgi:hypothetical protein